VLCDAWPGNRPPILRAAPYARRARRPPSATGRALGHDDNPRAMSQPPIMASMITCLPALASLSIATWTLLVRNGQAVARRPADRIAQWLWILDLSMDQDFCRAPANTAVTSPWIPPAASRPRVVAASRA